MRRALLIAPRMYSLRQTLIVGLRSNNIDAKFVDYRDFLNKNPFVGKLKTLIHTQESKFLDLQGKANKLYRQLFKEIKPEYVIIYNDELVDAATAFEFSKASKLIFLLGDNPLTLSPPNSQNVAILFHAHRVVVADTNWMRQLERIGLNNLHYDYLAYNPELFDTSNELVKRKRNNRLLFIGRTYGDAWGYKRLLFLKSFSESKIDIYGTGFHWNKWLPLFPEVKNRMVYQSPQKLPFEKMKELLQIYSIYPVDVNPGIVNGLHLRVFECVASGILPIVEYTEDIQLVFKGTEIPVLRSYSESQKISEYYLSNPDARVKILLNAIRYLDENYLPSEVIKRILNKL